MPSSPSTRRSLTDTLCRQCAICCNGLLFGDVELGTDDSMGALRRLGLRIRVRKGTALLLQPCAALVGKECGCYPDRPVHCRRFECLLFQAVADRRLQPDEALRRIRQTRRLAVRVGRLMGQLGETEDTLPMARRFQRLARRMESSRLDKDTAGLYAELTRHMHALKLRLAQWFYPG